MPNNYDRFLFSIRQFESETRLQFYADSSMTFVCSTRPEKCFLYEIAKNEDSLTFTRQRATWLYWRWLRRWLNNFYSPNSESTACKENDFRGWLRKCCSLHKAPLSLYNVSAATLFCEFSLCGSRALSPPECFRITKLKAASTLASAKAEGWSN